MASSVVERRRLSRKLTCCFAIIRAKCPHDSGSVLDTRRFGGVMRCSAVLAAVSFAGALALTAAPALAQHRGGLGRNGGHAAAPRRHVSVPGSFGPRAPGSPPGRFSVPGGRSPLPRV